MAFAVRRLSTLHAKEKEAHCTPKEDDSGMGCHKGGCVVIRAVGFLRCGVCLFLHKKFLTDFCPLSEQPVRDHSICEIHEQHAIEPNDDTDEEESREVQDCLICLEAFCVGDTVSYSSTKECNHAFHSSCIEGWLLSHIDCPTCRRMFLLIDYTRKKIPQDTLKNLAKKRKRRDQSTFFCVQHGVVALETEHQRKTLQAESMISSVSELGDMIADAEPLTAMGTNKEGMPATSAHVLPFRNVPESSTVSISLGEELNARGSIGGVQAHCDDEFRIIRSNGSTETTSTELSTSSNPSL